MDAAGVMMEDNGWRCMMIVDDDAAWRWMTMLDDGWGWMTSDADDDHDDNDDDDDDDDDDGWRSHHDRRLPPPPPPILLITRSVVLSVYIRLTGRVLHQFQEWEINNNLFLRTTVFQCL